MWFMLSSKNIVAPNIFTFTNQNCEELQKDVIDLKKIIVDSGIWTHALSDQNLNLAP